MKESGLERKLSLAVKKAKGYCIKLPANFYIGIPDRMLLLPGRVLFVELKVENGRVSPAQKNWQARFSRLGLTYYIIRGQDQLERFIHEQISVT